VAGREAPPARTGQKPLKVIRRRTDDTGLKSSRTRPIATVSTASDLRPGKGEESMSPDIIILGLALIDLFWWLRK